jgi:uncharacterized membrane protein YidH (DUF202 family)
VRSHSRRGSTGNATPNLPDARFSCANERTFLAWIRTALGLMTAGLAIAQLLPEFDFAGGHRLIGHPVIAVGVVMATRATGSGRGTSEPCASKNRCRRVLPNNY